LAEARRPRLTIKMSMSPSFGHGVEMELNEAEINEILKANGYSEVGHESVGPCGLTDYYRDEWRVTGPDGEKTDARRAISALMKKGLMALMTAPGN